MANDNRDWSRETDAGALLDLRWWEANYKKFLEDQVQLTILQFAEIVVYEELTIEGQESRIQDENNAQSWSKETGNPVRSDYSPTNITGLHPRQIAARNIIENRQSHQKYSDKDFSKIDAPQIAYHDRVESVGQMIQGQANVLGRKPGQGNLYDLAILIEINRVLKIPVPQIVIEAVRCKLKPADRLAAHVIEEFPRRSGNVLRHQGLYQIFLKVGEISFDGPNQISFKLKDNKEVPDMVGHHHGRYTFIVWEDALGNAGEFSLNDLTEHHIPKYIQI